MSFHVTKLFHPTLRSPNLDQSEQWIREKMGRVGKGTSSSPKAAEIAARNYPTDYATFTAIGDVILDTLDPSRYIVNGHQLYPSITQHELKELAWYVEGIEELFVEMQARGMGYQRQHGSDPDALPPLAAFADLVLFWTNPDETGLRYELYDPRGGMMDPRKYAGWSSDDSIAPELDGDPLGVLRGAYHVILTANVDRALGFYVGLLKGEVIHRGRSHLFAADSTYVALGDGVYELAVPDQGSVESAALAPYLPHDNYYSIVWHVSDIEMAAQHLHRSGVGVSIRTETGLVTEPQDSLDVPFGFTGVLIPGDKRA